MPVPDRREPVERHLLRDTAHEALCEAIVAGTLSPGERLHDEELCAWLGLSRTPVREALARLADEGLVETAPQRFTRVTPMSARDAQELFPVLAALHALAAELAVPRLVPELVARLHAENERFVRATVARDQREAFDADACFHGIFVDAAGSPDLVRILHQLEPRLRRLQLNSGGLLPGRRSVAQHQSIAERAAAGDAAGAANATRENWLTLGARIATALTPVAV